MDIHSWHSTWRTRYKNLSSRQQNQLKLLGLLVLIILCLIAVKSCATISAKHGTPNAPMLIRQDNQLIIPKDSPLRKELNVQPVKISDAPHEIVFPGVIEANPAGNISIFPPVTGNLLRLNVSLGEHVKAGQLLAVMQSPTFAQASSDLLKAQSSLKLTNEALQRAQKVNRAGANSVKDIEQLQNNYQQAQAELQRAQTSLTALGVNQDSLLQIKAPIDGTIIALTYGAGSFINDPNTPLFILSNINSVWVTLCVPENLISQVQQGQKVEVRLNAYPHQKWSGSINFTNQVLESNTRCNGSRVFLENVAPKLQPNMFAAVHTQIPQQDQIMVPLSAILMNNDTTSVFVETAPWTFEARPVVLGAEDGNWVRIHSGLDGKEHIVMAGGILIND